MDALRKFVHHHHGVCGVIEKSCADKITAYCICDIESVDEMGHKATHKRLQTNRTWKLLWIFWTFLCND